MNNLLSILYYYGRSKWLANRFSTKEELEAYQQKQFIKFQKNVLSQSEFYKNLSGKIQDYPVMDKKTMMTHFSEINTVNVERDNALRLALKAEASRDFYRKPMISP